MSLSQRRISHRQIPPDVLEKIRKARNEEGLDTDEMKARFGLSTWQLTKLVHLLRLKPFKKGRRTVL